MKKIRRTAAWLLTLLCASAVPALMTACADSAQTPQNDTAPATDTTAVTETAAPSIYDVLPEKDGKYSNWYSIYDTDFSPFCQRVFTKCNI